MAATYTGDYSRTGKPEADTSSSLVGKAAEAAGRVVGTVEEAAKSAGDKASSLAGKVSDTAGRLVDTIEEAAPALREARESVAEVGSDLDAALRKAVKDQPLLSLAIVMALGLAIGALWKK